LTSFLNCVNFSKKEESYIQTVAKKSKKKEVNTLVNDISNIIDNTVIKMNWEKLKMYWNIGKRVNDFRIENNSKWGDGVILASSRELSMKYGRGFSRQSINRMCLFNKRFEIASPETQTNKKNLITSALTQSKSKILIGSPASQSISWWHYVELFRFEDNNEIIYYLTEIANNKWTKDYLIEQKKTKSYQRLVYNQKENSTKKAEKYIKDPIIHPIKNIKTEKDLENEIVSNIQDFMRNLGSGYSFTGNQIKMIINNATYRVDLLFYNKYLRSNVLVDLKIGKIKRNDIAQMNMYINYFNKHELEEEIIKQLGLS